MTPKKSVFCVKFKNETSLNVIAVDIEEAHKKAAKAHPDVASAGRIIYVSELCVIDVE